MIDDYCVLGLAGTTSYGDILASALIGFYRPLAFTFLKMEYALFGWEYPGAYIVVSFLIHLVVLVGCLVRFIMPGRGPVALLSSAIFLLSPWVGENFFWLTVTIASAKGEGPTMRVLPFAHRSASTLARAKGITVWTRPSDLRGDD